jgi:hypothetical protein
MQGRFVKVTSHLPQNQHPPANYLVKYLAGGGATDQEYCCNEEPPVKSWYGCWRLLAAAERRFYRWLTIDG